MLKFSLVSVVFFSALAFTAADADVPQILTATVGDAKFVSDSMPAPCAGAWKAWSGLLITHSPIDEIQRVIGLEGELSEGQRSKLMENADSCPASRALENEIKVRSRLARA